MGDDKLRKELAESIRRSELSNVGRWIEDITERTDIFTRREVKLYELLSALEAINSDLEEIRQTLKDHNL